MLCIIEKWLLIAPCDGDIHKYTLLSQQFLSIFYAIELLRHETKNPTKQLLFYTKHFMILIGTILNTLLHKTFLQLL